MKVLLEGYRGKLLDLLSLISCNTTGTVTYDL